MNFSNESPAVLGYEFEKPSRKFVSVAIILNKLISFQRCPDGSNIFSSVTVLLTKLFEIETKISP